MTAPCRPAPRRRSRRLAEGQHPRRLWALIVALAIGCAVLFALTPGAAPAEVGGRAPRRLRREDTGGGPLASPPAAKKKFQSAGFATDSIISGAALVLTVFTVIIARRAEQEVDDADLTGGDPPLWAIWTAYISLLMLFALWYFFNIYFNIYNKLVLKSYAIPLSLTWMQFAIGVGIVLLMWLVRAHPFYRATKRELIFIVPLALLHVLGNLFTNLSLNAVAVSFTHTIKASEPLFAAFLSWLFLTPPTCLMIGALVPVMVGVGLASFTEATFNWTGFLTAMSSNLSFQTRNVVSKKLMSTKRPEDDGPMLDNINLFGYITLMSCVIMTPVMLLFEGFPFTPAWAEAHGNQMKFEEFALKSVYAGFFFHTYQQVSYLILDRVTPVTHAVGNCVKRIAVIVVSIIIFRNPVGLLNAIGITVAMLGVLMYSVAKKMQPGAKKDIPDGEPGGHVSRKGSLGRLNSTHSSSSRDGRSPSAHSPLMRKRSRGKSADLQYSFKF